jgi:hypothetical protein
LYLIGLGSGQDLIRASKLGSQSHALHRPPSVHPSRHSTSVGCANRLPLTTQTCLRVLLGAFVSLGRTYSPISTNQLPVLCGNFTSRVSSLVVAEDWTIGTNVLVPMLERLFPS